MVAICFTAIQYFQKLHEHLSEKNPYIISNADFPAANGLITISIQLPITYEVYDILDLPHFTTHTK